MNKMGEKKRREEKEKYVTHHSSPVNKKSQSPPQSKNKIKMGFCTGTLSAALQILSQRNGSQSAH
jgi:hypothetical protein